MQGALAVLNTDLAKTNEQAQLQFKQGIDRSAANVRNALNTSIAVALAVIVCLVAVSHFVVRAIWQQLGGEPEYARQIARAVADGDLSMEIVTESGDQASLLAALKEMRGRLAGMVSGIKASAETIQVASAEIAQGNADLAARTESQAGSLDQTARSMDNLTVHRARQRRQCGPGARTGGVGIVCGREGRASGQPGGHHHGRDQRFIETHRRHHRRHRRHRLPDEHPGLERGRGSGARRRAGTRLCRGGLRSAQPRAAQRGSGARDQGTDRRFGRQGQRRARSWSTRRV